MCEGGCNDGMFLTHVISTVPLGSKGQQPRLQRDEQGRGSG